MLTLFDNRDPSSRRRETTSSWNRRRCLDRLVGGTVVGLFVATWVGSLASPLVLAYAMYRGTWTTVVTALALLTIAAYAPWQRGAVGRWMSSWFQEPYFRLYRSFRLWVCRPDHHDNFDNDTTTTNTTNTNSPKPTFYAVHTHGAFCMGWGALFCHPAFSHVRFCFAPALYASPLFRLFARLVGKPGSASKAAMQGYMKRQQDVALPPGGFEEATLTDVRQDRVFLQKRTGFIKLCLQHGYRVRPVYCFGEKKTYWNWQGAWNWRLALNRLGVPAIFVWGTPLLPLVPKHDFDFTIVVGPPLDVPHLPEPTREQVQRYHAMYVRALQTLFDEHKERAYGPVEGGTDCKLEIW
mmetsp:Transcript_21714/g.60334  ORF Transcript_21714/g.60334 Transcript_21714/m.60334 type:complete len:352 (-) Transcript_21714:160-1215(-)